MLIQLLTGTDGFRYGYKLNQYHNLDDGASNLNVYVGDDEKIHFTNWAGADTVLPFSGKTTHTETYTGTAAQLGTSVDMGADHTYRYFNLPSKPAPSITYKDYKFPSSNIQVSNTSQSKSIVLSGYTVIGGGLVSSQVYAPGEYVTVTCSASVSATTATWSCSTSKVGGTIYANSQTVRVWYYAN